MAELVDALDLESSGLGREGSSPSSRNLFIDEKNDELVDLYLEHIFSGKPDPTSKDILQYILQKEFGKDWVWGTLLNHVIWWNSDTKLDPRLANVFFLE